MMFIETQLFFLKEEGLYQTSMPLPGTESKTFEIDGRGKTFTIPSESFLLFIKTVSFSSPNLEHPYFLFKKKLVMLPMYVKTCPWKYLVKYV